VTDGDRRRLLVLASARSSAKTATAVVQRLLVDLRELKIARAVDAADEMATRLVEIDLYLTKLIGEVPS
jgi:hypothetical protein